VLIVTQALAPLIAASGGGRIVNQSSTAAYMGGGDPYSVCKAAVTALTMGLAGELAAKGITVNAIAPGPVPTEAMKGVVPDATLERIAQSTPIARLGTPDDMLNALRFLVSEQSSWVTGQTIIVDGGMVRRF
jgi:NAD(P)-dependent dehydrogenase (short-subunit alcohol dehydrogenase family)